MEEKNPPFVELELEDTGEVGPPSWNQPIQNTRIEMKKSESSPAILEQTLTSEESLFDDIFNFEQLKRPKEAAQNFLKRIEEAPKEIEQQGKSFWAWLKYQLTTWNYIKVHVLYYVFFSIVGGILIQLCEVDKTPSFTDSYYMSVSSVTTIGLSSMDISKLREITQVVLFLLMQIGSPVMVTIVTVIVRRKRIWDRFLNAPKIVPKDGEGIEAQEDPIDEAELALRDKEYKALGKLMKLIIGYILVPYFLSILILTLYFTLNEDMASTLKERGVNPFWCALFHTISAFNNGGLALFNDNLTPFNTHPLPLFIFSFLIILGNTGYPIFLRLLVWIGRRTSKNFSAYKMLLVRPRELFTHLFPATQTKLLVLVWIIIALFQFFTLLILDFDHPSLVGMSTGDKLMNFYFTTISTRTAGFNTININEMNSGSLVLFVIFMYVSSYPFTLTLHQSMQIKEESVDPYAVDEEVSQVDRDLQTGERLDKKAKKSTTKAVFEAMSWHTQGLFFKHIVWIIALWFLMVSIESDRMKLKENDGIFRIIFEIASAYGTVGLSLSFNDMVASFSSALSGWSKWAIIFIMFLGRHRGLPSSLDPAIDLYRKDKRK